MPTPKPTGHPALPAENRSGAKAPPTSAHSVPGQSPEATEQWLSTMVDATSKPSAGQRSKKPATVSRDGSDAGISSSASRDPIATLERINSQWRVAFGRLDIDLTAMTILVTLARKDGNALQGDIRALIGISEASMTRNLALLSDGTSGRVPGPRLIESYEDHDNRTRRRLRLTARGRAVLSQFSDIIVGA